MEVRAHGIRLLMNMLLLLMTTINFGDFQRHDSAFPQVVPNRQQFFELESISISCEGLNGLTGWRVMKKTKGHVRQCASTWDTSTGPCNIINAYPSSDSGEYWCENGGIQRSDTVNITVTGGPVILDSPVNPVTEGDKMTLHCRKKDKNSNFTADFYKSGISIGHSPTGNMMNPSVSKSDEGVYKCSISDTGESAESWLNVRSLGTRAQTEESYFHVYLGVGVSMMVLLLLLAGLFYWLKYQQNIQGHTEEMPLAQKASEVESTQATYAVITKPRMMKESRAASWSACSLEPPAHL
ncbi:unnamed protein product [Oreochromis niloticus]|nr:unnamed protein product [Mustela putorius furo]